jgi:hypothetical protein
MSRLLAARSGIVTARPRHQRRGRDCIRPPAPGAGRHRTITSAVPFGSAKADQSCSQDRRSHSPWRSASWGAGRSWPSTAMALAVHPSICEGSKVLSRAALRFCPSSGLPGRLERLSPLNVPAHVRKGCASSRGVGRSPVVGLLAVAPFYGLTKFVVRPETPLPVRAHARLRKSCAPSDSGGRNLSNT